MHILSKPECSIFVGVVICVNLLLNHPVPLWFNVISLVSLNLGKISFSGVLQFKRNFVRGYNNPKDRDWDPFGQGFT